MSYVCIWAMFRLQKWCATRILGSAGLLTEQDWNQVFLGCWELLPNLSARPEKHFPPHAPVPLPALVIFRISPPLHVSCGAVLQWMRAEAK